jgi:hypothetical protein
MNKTQSMHVGMINSYNVLMGKASIEQIVQSGLGIFAHVPDEEPNMETIQLIIHYFQDHEMFEHCIDLVKYIEQNFNSDGSSREENCECNYPSVTKYEHRMTCSTCNKRLRK